MNPKTTQRILPLVLIAAGVAGCLYFAFGGSTDSQPSDTVPASDSIHALCNSAEQLIAAAPADDATSDLPGESYIKACRMLDSSANIARRHHLPSDRIDSLRSTLIPALSLTLTSIDARLKVVEGIPAAESALLQRRSQILTSLDQATRR